MFATFFWDPDRTLFIFPYIDHPVTWYGFLFAFGFLVGYFLIRKIFLEFLAEKSSITEALQLEAVQLSDRLSLATMLGGIIGARLGHVFFYEWFYFREHPAAIVKVWEGGLASHGGAIGILIALVLFLFVQKRSYPRLTFLYLLDVLVIATSFAAGCIRIGNFINQELAGIPTQLPWGVIFGHPVEGIAGVPLHPVQLYESFFYFSVFLFLCLLWRVCKSRLGSGLYSGLFFLLVFGFRFFIEPLKVPLHPVIDYEWQLRMGQILSLPFIGVGIALLIFFTRKRIDDPSR